MKAIRSLFLLLILTVQCVTLAAQNRVVTGTVLDTYDEPLVGVTVRVEGTTTGGATDVDGNFNLKVPSGTVVLNVSYVGYATQKVTVAANQSNVKIVMKENAIQLEETVVVGYGTQKKVNLTGAVAVVSDKDLENRAAPTLSSMLQGTTPGLNITTSSGVPGDSPSINVRGTTSINSTSPLVLIDGVEGDISRVNPNDVASVSIIKDASAAAVYGARAAFGVILVTTKSGDNTKGKATVRYSGRFGWEESTASTDYESTGYWSVYTVNTFWQARNGTKYIDYNDNDMMQLLARVNDKTENPDRPWTVEETRNGKKQWVYYGNYDWYNMLYNKRRPTQQHNVSMSGGNDAVKYFVSGGYQYNKGLLKANPDIYRKYNLRSKIDFKINKWASFSNNTSFYGSNYQYQGDGSVENTLGYSARHALACFPMQNPDGSWLYSTPYTSYKIANGRHILISEGTHRNKELKTDFTNTSRLVLTPIEHLSVTADFTYRLNQGRYTRRTNPFYYREYPDGDLLSYATGAGQNKLSESANTYTYYTLNAYATYTNSWKKHNLTATAGYNYEAYNYKRIYMQGYNLASDDLDDISLAETYYNMDGGQNEYKLSGIFGRVNYDYAGRYLLELSGRYDGTSRFIAANRWGFFPSASVGWRISEENFFKNIRPYVNNLKARVSYGSLGNQNVSSYYTYMRLVTVYDFGSYSFGTGSKAKYSSLGAPVASDLTWETAKQWNFGIDFGVLDNRLTFTGDYYVRKTVDMLTDGIELPAVYGADVPQMNTADLQTKGYELQFTWRDNVSLFGKKLNYSLGFNLSDYRAEITKYDNKDKSFAKSYYVGKRIGEIWGFVIDGLFQSDEEAEAYSQQVDLSYVGKNLGPEGKWKAGDVRYVDLDGDGKIGIGSNNVNDPGDRKVLGNSLPSLQYGINASVNYCGFDASVFFQGTGNHYWYPAGQSMPFWGTYSYPYLSFLQKNFMDQVWSEDNTDAYFPRAMAYASTSGTLSFTNSRYLQNIRYLRFKNLTVGYSLPKKITRKAYIDNIRVYFTGENLYYWSPIKKHSKYIDPEACLSHSTDVYDNAFYPWSKTYMFGIDVTF
jgi:TonB-linked SusC/RagA family outer membrane protein